MTQPETEDDCDGLFAALSELFALVMASLVSQPNLAPLHGALDAFGARLPELAAEALLQAEDDALDAIRLAAERVTAERPEADGDS